MNTVDPGLPAVVHNVAAQRFELRLNGQLCVCEYRRQGELVAFTHTEVPSALAGQGLAGRLVETALAWVRAEGFRARPLCSYVSVYLRRHPGWADIVAR